MVCVNQATAKRSEEPFVTLAKTRRTDGKVYFGTHMALYGDIFGGYQTVQVGDPIVIEGVVG
jgi:molybdenum cofactor sulfurtransferase